MSATVLLLVLFAEEHIQAARQAYDSGLVAIADGRWSDAEKLFLKAMDIEPTYSDAYRSLIDVCIRTSRPTDAGAILTRLLQIEPNSVGDRTRLGRLLIEGREWNRALAQFSIARRLAPDDPDALYGFALAASKSGMTAVAIDAGKLGRARFHNDQRFINLLKALEMETSVGKR
jgi:tetratricopeptide (TPR) repeat protein